MNFSHLNTVKVAFVNIASIGIGMTGLSENIQVGVGVSAILFTVAKTIDIVRKWYLNKPDKK